MLRHPEPACRSKPSAPPASWRLEAARRPLLLLLDDELLDSELRAAIYWSLSKIGGDDVREILEDRLEETEDEEDVEILEDALENLDFTEEMNLFDMLDLDDLPEEDETPEEYLSRHPAKILDPEELNRLPEDEEPLSAAHETSIDLDDPADEADEEKDSGSSPKSDSAKRHHRHRRSG